MAYSRFILFRVAEAHFIADIMSVRQIVPHGGATPVPKAPSFIEGMVMIDGSPVPVVDLGQRLYSRSGGSGKIPLVIIIETEAGNVGMKVDEVRKIVEVDSDEILPPPPLVQGIAGEQLVGVIRRGDDMLLVLDLDHVLSAGEAADLARRMPRGGAAAPEGKRDQRRSGSSSTARPSEPVPGVKP